MEVQFTPEVAKKLNELAALSGRPARELAQDAVTGFVDELAETREMLDHRYDDIKSGKAMMIPGNEAFARLMAKTEALRKRSQ